MSVEAQNVESGETVMFASTASNVSSNLVHEECGHIIRFSICYGLK